MLDALKRHPFAVEAYFKSSVVLTFAFPKEDLEPLIPECLTLDTYDDKWGFVAVAMVQTKQLRPKGFPSYLGNDFFLIGYRIFTRYRDVRGKSLRGLYILKSQADKIWMTIVGNIFTHYNYTKIDVQQDYKGDQFNIYDKKGGFKIEYRGDKTAPLPNASPFSDWKKARRYAGPLPFTFQYDNENKEVMIIEGVRSNWKPEPIHVETCEVPFLDQLPISKPILANAFRIKDVPYYWKKGRTETWNYEK